MKKVLIILLLVFSLLINDVNAECDDKTRLEINTAASNVSANLEMVKKVIDLEGNLHPEIDEELAFVTGSGYTRTMFTYINIDNINDKIYLNITSEDDDIDQIIDINNSLDGKWQYQVPDIYEIRNYTIKVYSNVDGCKDEEVRTLNIKSPMYNLYSESRLCENNDAYYCQEYITTPIDMDVIELMLQKEEETKNKEQKNVQNNSNFKNIWFYFGTGIIIILILGIIFVVVKIFIKKHRDKKYMEMGL